MCQQCSNPHGGRIMADDVAVAWPCLVQLVRNALARGSGEYTADDVLDLLATDKWQLWTDDTSMVCTSVVQYPARRVLYINLASGDRDSIMPLWDMITEFARRNGCGIVQFFARRGWMKSGLLPRGAVHTHDLVTVEL